MLGGGLVATAALSGPRFGRADRAYAATQRPIADFVNAEGTTGIFVPPVADFIGWGSAAAKPPVRFASVDYAELADTYLSGQGLSLGTRTAGQVTEQELADGRAKVSVVLHTTDALTWVIAFDP